MTDLQSLIRGWEERADKIAGRSHSDDALVAAYQTCAQQLWEALTPYKESTEPRSETAGERSWVPPNYGRGQSRANVAPPPPDAAEKPKRIWECNVCGHANPVSIDTCEECGEGLYRPASPDAAEGEERWGSFADPKWAWALDADNNVIEGPRQPRLAAHVPLWVVPRARAEAAEADKRDLREELDEALARATTAEEERERLREVAERARVRWEHAADERDEQRQRANRHLADGLGHQAHLMQAESQLAHYKAEVERLRGAIEEHRSFAYSGWDEVPGATIRNPIDGRLYDALNPDEGDECG